MYPLNEVTVQEIQKAYTQTDLPWYLGYSGGKDSSALLTLVFNAALSLRINKPITILYCNTAVDIPIVKAFVVKTLEGIRLEAEKYGLPIQSQIIEPPINDRFFVKMIGRGYPPPTNKFRWCTKRLQINPVKNYFDNCSHEQQVLLLGVRRGESSNRDRSLSRYRTEDRYYFRQVRIETARIFTPIIDYTVEDVWATLELNPLPESIDVKELMHLYKDIGGRFGCWTCTVVRQDRAMQRMIEQGYNSLIPLLDFKNWLMQIRDDQAFRCPRRRNGQPGLGPFTLAAREKILEELLEAQDQTRFQLITEEEIGAIEDLWELDKKSSSYSEV